MPSPSDFRKAFSLSVDQVLDGKWRIARSSFGHDVKVQNERYEFPASLEVEWTGGSGSGGKRATDRRRQLEASWARQTSERRIVYSAYGSPYECCFVKAPKVAPLDEGGSRFQVTALGRAVRRRDIPALKEARAAEREAAGAAEVSKEDERRYLGDCRVIKSRFGTSQCGICGQTIDPGVKIAKGEGSSGRGGWAHATCLVQQMKAEGGGGGKRGGAAQVGGDAEEAGGSSSKAESEEEAPPPKRTREVPAAAGKGGRSGGGSRGGRGRKAAVVAQSKGGSSGSSKGKQGVAGEAVGKRRRRASPRHEE